MAPQYLELDLLGDAIEEVDDLARAADKLPRILAAVAEVGPQVGIAALARKSSETTGVSVPELRRLLAALLNFYHTQVQLKLDTAATAEVVTAAVKRQAATPEGAQRLKAWEAAKPKIVEAVRSLHADHPLEAASKAFRVAASRQYDLVRMKLFTDMRPVFNDAGDAIVQTIITHVLSLDYHDGEDHHVIQFNLDANDVVELRRECERAERKAAVIKRDLKSMSWPTSIFRETTDPDAHGK